MMCCCNNEPDAGPATVVIAPAVPMMTPAPVVVPPPVQKPVVMEKAPSLHEHAFFSHEPAVEEKVEPAKEEPAKEPSLVLHFETPDGSTITKVMHGRPLGLDFNKTVPLEVRGTRPGGRAEKLGIQAKWKLMKVNDAHVDGRAGSPQTIDEVKHHLTQVTASLPPDH
uniref:PDZ domain-containing protein n=1 Tax=Zooxanthella nutricula TaxID=1333877 RepID=A0A7S2JI33_9DINO